MQTRFEANRKFWPEASLSQVHRLIATYADINQPDEEGWTPVQWAARWGDFEIMHALLAAGADAVRFDRNGRNALHLAVRWGNLQTTGCLLAEGADIHAVTEAGASVLHLAGERASAEELAAVLEAARFGQTPPPSDGHVRDDWGNADMIALLTAEGADSQATDAQGNTPLHYAADHVVTLDALVAAGVPIDTKNDEGETPLLHLARYGRGEAVLFLLAHGADPMTADKDGQTALNLAAENKWLASEDAQARLQAAVNRKLNPS